MTYYNIKVYASYYNKDGNTVAVKDYHYNNVDSLDSLKEYLKSKDYEGAVKVGIVMTKYDETILEESFDL